MEFGAIAKIVIVVAVGGAIIFSALKKSRSLAEEIENESMGKDDIKDTDVFDAYKKMIGFQGVSMSDFATSGRVLIFGKVFDALCEGEPIEKGEDIEVVGSEGNKLIVKGIELEEEVEEIEEEVSSENLEVSETTEE